jgi:hypothetical protein
MTAKKQIEILNRQKKFSRRNRYTNRGMKSRADKLSSHFDNEWPAQKSRIREVRTERVNYSPTYSWDAKSDDPNSFSKLNADQLPTQPTRPCTLSGARVIELETSGGIDVLNGTQRSHALTGLPLTTHQTDIGMVGTDLTGTIPLASNATQNGQKLYMKNNYTFKNYSIQPPQFTAEEIPEFYREAGAHGDQKLLNPAQRRKMMEIDAQNQLAKGHVDRAISERHKLKTSLSGPNHHRGVLMVDDPSNINSEIYGQKAQEAREKYDKMNRSHEQRLQNLQRCGGVLSADYGNMIPSNAPQESLFQTKRSTGSTLSFQETYTRVFEKVELKPPRPERTQHLRDQDLLGKNYNIITNTTIVYGKSSIPERKDKILSHPSQQSLNSNRNLHGSLRPI